MLWSHSQLTHTSVCAKKALTVFESPLSIYTFGEIYFFDTRLSRRSRPQRFSFYFHCTRGRMQVGAERKRFNQRVRSTYTPPSRQSRGTPVQRAAAAGGICGQQPTGSGSGCCFIHSSLLVICCNWLKSYVSISYCSDFSFFAESIDRFCAGCLPPFFELPLAHQTCN